MADPVQSRVFLVGAGPGDPGLLTVRAAELLGTADLIVHDQIIPQRILDLASPVAEVVCIRDLPVANTERSSPIEEKLIEAARAGKTVVRLKGGDPFVFGREAEEIERLRLAGLAYEVVPGVTAALAAAAYLDVPLTHPIHSSAIALITGHELPNRPGSSSSWESLARFPGTLAIYMGMARLPVIISELMKYGLDSATPSAVVERASTGEMRSVFAPLAELEAHRRQSGLEAPGLILIGKALSQRRTASWFETKPLFGRRVLVTRPRHQAGPMLRKLELLGAVTYLMPTVEIREPADSGPLDAAIARLQDHGWDWIVFTSANGVHAFLKRLFALGLDLRALGGKNLAAIGPKTAAALGEYHLRSDLVPSETFSSEGLSDELVNRVSGKRVLLARADRGRDVLPVELRKIALVEQVIVYEQSDVVDLPVETLDALRRGEIEFVTLSSSNVARSLLRSFDETMRGRVRRGEIRLVAISPVTAEAVRELGYPVSAEAEVYTTDGLIDAVVKLAVKPKSVT